MTLRHSLGGLRLQLPLLAIGLALLATVLALPAQAQRVPDPNTQPKAYDFWKNSQTESSESISPQAPSVPSARAESGDVAAHGGGLLIPYMDDGTWTSIPRNDDGFSGVLALPFGFELYGTTYNDICVNNNGNISFNNDCYSTFTPNGFPDNTFVMVAPFWGDVDTRCADCGLTYYKETTFNGQTVFVAHWEAVGYYSQHSDLLSTFQVIIADEATLPGGNNVCFGYEDMAWTTGDASQGVGGFGGAPATVGANAGDGTNFFQIGRFDHEGTDYDGPGGNADGVSFLDGQQFCFNTGADAGNVPPVISAAPSWPDQWRPRATRSTSPSPSSRRRTTRP